MFLLKSQVISNIALGLKSDSIVDLGHIVKSKSLTLYRHDALVQYQRIFRKIIIETYLEHLMFVRKCQAILKKRFGLVVDKFFELRHIFES